VKILNGNRKNQTMEVVADIGKNGILKVMGADSGSKAALIDTKKNSVQKIGEVAFPKGWSQIETNDLHELFQNYKPYVST